MAEIYKYKKPKTVSYAEYTLLTWTAWTCFYGIYDAWVQIPEAQKIIDEQINSQSEGQFSFAVSAQTMMHWAVGFYVFAAIISLFFVYKVAKGKSWARASFLWSFIFEILFSVIWIVILYMTGSSPGLTDWLSYIPDYGLQAYALYFLYTWPGDRWFVRNGDPNFVET